MAGLYLEPGNPNGAFGRWSQRVGSPGTAQISVQGNQLVVRLRWGEKAGAIHGDVRLPLSSVSGVHVAADPWSELRGIRAPGTGIPGLIALGTWRGRFGKDFVAVYRRTPAVVVDLSSAPYVRIMVSTPDADAVTAKLRPEAA